MQRLDKSARRPPKLVITYTDEQSWHGPQNRQGKERGHDLGRAAGIGSEGVMDLGPLAVAKRLLIARSRRIRIGNDFEIEDGGVQALGRSERCHDYRGPKGFGSK